jgi:hypothetical protein
MVNTLALNAYISDYKIIYTFTFTLSCLLDDMECPEAGMGQEVVDAGDLKRLQCSVGYHGRKAPSLNWRQEEGTPTDDVKNIYIGISNDNVTLV